MKKTMKVYGSHTGEGVIYQTTNEDLFIVDTAVRISQRAVNDLCKKFVKNPDIISPGMQVTPVNRATKRSVEYYSSDKPKDSDVFKIIDPCDAIWYEAIKKYNNLMLSKRVNKAKTFRYEVVSPKNHGQSEKEFASLRGTSGTSRKINLVDATRYYREFHEGNPKTFSRGYQYIDQDAERIMRVIEGVNQYNESAVSAALSVQGDWSVSGKRDYRRGDFVGYNINRGKDVITELNFLSQLRELSKGRFKLTCGKFNMFAKFYSNTVYNEKEVIDLNRILNFLRENQDKAFGSKCLTCDQHIDGYIDRINKVGEHGFIEDWKSIYMDISREPEF